MEEVITVDYLLNILKKLQDNGYGHAVIKCADSCIRQDEISIVYGTEPSVRFRGYLFNQPIAKKAQEFQEDIEKAIRKLYGIEY